MTAKTIAESTFEQHIRQNSYPGRGLVLGKMENDKDWIVIYFIMGRSENSRNRRFAFVADRLWTEPVDESKVQDPSLIIYDAMLALPQVQLVSNGDQTRTIYDTIKNGGTFQQALDTREREPDSPNFTPRISGMLDFRQETPSCSLSILKANRNNTDLTDRITFTPSLPEAGYGYGLTTYMGDGNPLPSFTGDPLLLPTHGTPESILNSYWDALDPANRVSLAVKRISPKGELIQILTKNCHQ